MPEHDRPRRRVRASRTALAALAGALLLGACTQPGGAPAAAPAGAPVPSASRTPDGRLLIVGTGAVEPGKGRGPSLTVRSPDGAERVYPLDGPHEDVAVSRDGRTAYVTGGYTRDGYWNGITVVDLDTGNSRRLAAGSRPLGIAVL